MNVTKLDDLKMDRFDTLKGLLKETPLTWRPALLRYMIVLTGECFETPEDQREFVTKTVDEIEEART